MDVLVLLALAIAPGTTISLFVYVKDRFNREPRRLLIVSFILGALATIPAAIIESQLIHSGPSEEMLPSLASVAVVAFLFVGFTEEFCKFLVLRFYAFPKKAFNEPFDGIMYGVMVSMGFATLENILYVSQYGMGNAFVRMFTAVPAHATFGVMMGYYAGLAKFSRWGFFYLLAGLLLATFFHGAYDFFLMQKSFSGMTAGALVSLIAGIWYSLKAIRLHRKNSPFRDEPFHDHSSTHT